MSILLQIGVHNFYPPETRTDTEYQIEATSKIAQIDPVLLDAVAQLPGGDA